MTADPHEMSQDRGHGASGLSLGADGYRTLFEHVDAMACMLDLEGRFTAVNPAGERLTGYTADDLVGRFAVELIAPAQREEAVERFKRRIRTSGNLPPDESVLLTKAGESIPIEVRSVQVLEDGHAVGVLGLVRDLRPERLVENALHESEEQFRSAFEHGAVGMALLALDGSFIRVNGALGAMLGYTPDELVGLHFSEVTHADDVGRQESEFERLLAGEADSCEMEKRYVRRDGSELWSILSVSLVRSSDGSPLHFISQVQDIDSRRRAELRTVRSESQLAEAQAIARLGSWKRDLATDEVEWSAELYKIFGVDPDAGPLTYARFLDVVAPEDRADVARVRREADEVGTAFEDEYRIVLPSGEERWIHSRGNVVESDGVPIAMVGTAQDVTEEREAELRLREAEERYRTLVEQLPLVTYVRPLDMHASNLYVSPQVEDMLGTPVEAWLNDPDLLGRIVHPDDRERVLADGERVRTTGEPSRAEYRYVLPDGRLVWVLDQTHLLLDGDGRPIAVQGFLVDVTERKRTEDERDRLHDALHHAQKLEALGRLAGGVAHDFNNMLTAIKGYAELLLESLPAGAVGRAEAEQIHRAASQASVLPRQLLAFGRKQELQPSVIPLDRTLAEAGGLLTRLGTEDVDVTVVPGAGTASVVADPRQLEQALLNLALNARAAMPDGGTITVSTRTEHVSAAVAEKHGVMPGRYAVVSVADTGAGMDEVTKARAFEPFFTTKSHGEGTGLGLSMVYGFVTQSGGFVEVESALGEGSRFEVYLPQTVAEPGAGHDGRDDRPEDAACVLLVEDEDVVRDLARTTLERAGFAVVAARTATEALEHCERDQLRVDVLVSDMVMPGMGGRELAERFLAVRPNSGVVLMSGYTDELDALDERHAFLRKPFAPRELVELVETALERRQDGERAAKERPTCLVADDHPAVLDSVARYLEHQGIDVVAAVARGDEALAEIASLRPALALLDVSMSPVGGIDVARRAASESPETRTVLYTGHRDAALLEQALDAGARGFVLKEAPLSELVRALEVVGSGGTYVDPELSGALTRLHATASSSPLTRREREVLALLANGLTNEKVAAELGISAETVQSHVGRAMSKLEADTRTEAVATALRQSLIA